MSKVTVVSRPNRITIASKGVQGAPGPQGEQGIQGPKGDTGDVTPEAIAARDAAQEAASSAQEDALAAAGSAAAADSAAQARVQEFVSQMALASTSLLSSIGGARSQDVARVVDPRDGGYWQWQSGDVSSLVAADPYGAMWRAPASVPSGASGAWMRVVDNGVFDAEWALPEVMPANAQDRLNAMIASLPGGARRFLLPRRGVSITGQIVLKKGIDYIGAGDSGFIDGGGAAIHCVVIAGNGARVYNVHAGNVAGGQIGMGEPSAFHISDGLPVWSGQGYPVERVSIIGCRARNAETGIRIGYNGIGGDSNSTVFGSRDTYIENFTCDGIRNIGIESMRAHGVTVIGGTIRMDPGPSPVGLRRCFRIVGAHDQRIIGTRMIGPDVSTVIGVSLEEAGNGTSRSGSTRVTVDGVSMENMGTCVRVAAACHALEVSNSRADCRSDSMYSTFLQIVGGADDASAPRAIKVVNNQALNTSTFADLQLRCRGVEVSGNLHISNSASNGRFINTSGTNLSIEQATFESNTSYLKSAGLSGGAVRLQFTSATSSIRFDGNRFTPDGAGVVFSTSGDATIITRNSRSNTSLDPSLWAQVKTANPLEEYN